MGTSVTFLLYVINWKQNQINWMSDKKRVFFPRLHIWMEYMHKHSLSFTVWEKTYNAAFWQITHLDFIWLMGKGISVMLHYQDAEKSNLQWPNWYFHTIRCPAEILVGILKLYSCVRAWLFRSVLRIQVKMLFQVTDINAELQRRAGGRWPWAYWAFYLLLCNFSHLLALGVLMWEVFSEGKIPYENRTNGEVVEEINAGFRLYKPKLASKAIYEVMSHCWRMVSIVMGKP